MSRMTLHDVGKLCLTMQGMTLGKRIFEARKARDWSQARLGKEVGDTKAAVSNWERDANDPTLKKLREISRALVVKTSWLLSEEGYGPVGPAHQPAVEISKQLDGHQRAIWFQMGNEAIELSEDTTFNRETFQKNTGKS